MPKPRAARKPVVVDESAVVGHGNIRGKPIIYRDAKTVLTVESLGFKEKRLCDGPVLNLGDACAYNCEFCYVDGQMRRLDTPIIRKLNEVTGETRDFRDVIVRRRKNAAENGLAVLADQIAEGLPRKDEHLVLYTSTLVEIAPNLELLEETATACRMILENTAWDIRLLSKSPLTKRLVEKNMIPKKYHPRLIFGFSTGTLDDDVALAIETGAPRVSERLKALHWLQDNGYRTFAMLCPSLPQRDYAEMSKKLCSAVRISRCEHVWAEVINTRGSAFARTASALDAAGFKEQAAAVRAVTGAGNKPAWETYARETFLAHTQNVPANKLRFLQYVAPNTKTWWSARAKDGAIVLEPEEKKSEDASAPTKAIPLEIVGQPKPEPRNLAKEVIAEVTEEVLREGRTGITQAERAQLAKWEKTISRGLSAGLEAALCLYDIKTYRDGIFWKENFETFEAYCRAKWDYRKTHAYRLLGAGEFIADLQASPIGEKEDCDWFPRSEAHIRPLLALPKEARLEAWDRLVHETPAKQLTAKLVAGKTREVAKEVGIQLRPKRRKPNTERQALKVIAKLEKLAAGLDQADKIGAYLVKIREIIS